MLANLDNEVYFKKVFTDPEVFHAFVKDVTGRDIQVGKIETEKQLDRKISPIKFKLDIFAESVDHRVIIEIQKVDYDYNFDRWLHYFLSALVDLQRSSADYKFAKEVYTIIIVTAPYVVTERNGEPIKDDVLVSNLNPRTLGDIERDVYPHQLIFLNPAHINQQTPAEVRDWLQLIHESIYNRENPKINLSKPAIAKAAKLADIDTMPGEVLEEAKFDEMSRITRTIYENKARKEGRDEGREEGREEGKLLANVEGIKKALRRGKLTAEEIAEDFEVDVEFVLQLKKELCL